MRFIAEKLSIFDIFKKLSELRWNGRSFSWENTTTYLDDNNNTLAIIKFDNKKSKIISAEFKNKT